MRARASRPRRASASSKCMDDYGAGIDISGVNLTDVQLPDRGAGGAARCEQGRRRSTARHHRCAGLRQRHAAQGAEHGAAALTDAQVYATQTRATAEGDAERFTAQAQALRQGSAGHAQPAVHRDHRRTSWRKAHKIFIDAQDRQRQRHLSAARQARRGDPRGSSCAASGRQPVERAGRQRRTPAPHPASRSAAPDDAHDRERPER